MPDISEEVKVIKHYIGIDSNSYVIRGYTDEYMIPLEKDICINENGGKVFSINGVENPIIVNENGSHNYKYVDGTVIATTTDEQNAEVEATQLPLLKERKIVETKEKLKDYLANNPYIWTDKKQYSITEEKQNLLSNAIAVYQMKKAAGDTTAKLTWNSVGETCTEWTIENLIALAIAISTYVYPLVSHQQTLEVSIRNCKTLSDLDKVVISYATAS